MRHFYMILALSASVPAIAGPAGPVAPIVDEGMNRSEIAETAAYLSDRIGGRMTNSPQMREAERWTQQKFREYGLKNVRADPFAFGRGWSINRASARMTAPRPLNLTVIPVAWTPPTNGAVSAGVIVAPIEKERDFDKWRGKLAGKIVLISYPGSGDEPSKAPFLRYTGQELSDFNAFTLPNHPSPETMDKDLEQTLFAAKRDAFLKAEGARAWVSMAYRDGGLVSGEGYGFAAGQTPQVSGFQMAAEDYRRLTRLAKTDAAPTLELLSDVSYHDEDINAYNILAELPGSDPNSGYVMAGAHLDSWVASDGASDNGAGVVVVMEAARILSRLGLKPKRTIRFALWSGEEQGLLGSLAYIDKYLVSRPPLTDPAKTKFAAPFQWGLRWPVTLKPGAADLAAYFNLDHGSGKVRGVYTEGNLAVVPIFRDWLAPFASMGATSVVTKKTSGTDHYFLQAVGLPGYQFIQDPLDYGSRTHHSNVDSYDHLKIDDLRQAAVIMAAFLYNAADSDEPLPRTPVPVPPKPSDPFAYPRED